MGKTFSQLIALSFNDLSVAACVCKMYMFMCLCVRESQKSSVLDELAAGSSQLHSAGWVSSTDLCISKILNSLYHEILS